MYWYNSLSIFYRNFRGSLFGALYDTCVWYPMKHRSAPKEKRPWRLSLWGPLGETPPIRNHIFLDPPEAPEGTNTRVTSAKGHFYAYPRYLLYRYSIWYYRCLWTKTLLFWEPLHCNPAAQIALKPLICCVPSRSSHASSYPEEYLFRRRRCMFSSFCT